MKTVNTSLQKILFINAGFSVVSASSILLFPTTISTLMGFSDALWLQLVAIALVFFAVLVSFVALQKTTDSIWVNFIIIQDVLWVLGSIALIAIRPWNISISGIVLISAVAAIIALFAWIQHKHLSNSIITG